MIAAIKNSLARRTSVLGIDIGLNSIKMARMVCRSGLWSVANRVLLPIEHQSEEADVLESVTASMAPLRGRALPEVQPAACTLPRSTCDFRSVEVPSGTDDDVFAMATEAMRDCFPDSFDDRVTQVWRQNLTAGSMATISCVSVPSDLPSGLTGHFDDVGLQCDSIQGHPFVMARAAQLCPATAGDQPVAVLDWGYSTVSMTIVRSGKPEFVRTFRTCSGKSLVKAIGKELKLADDDAESVLNATRLPGKDKPRRVLFPAAADLLMSEVHAVAGEITRTLMYLRQHISGLLPTRMLLVGGMAAIPNLAETLHAQTGLESRPWSIGTQPEHPSEPTYAAAMTLSIGVPS